MNFKLCGNHSYEDLVNTINSKANYIGVVFAESKRKVDVFQLKHWLNKVKLRKNQKLVGIFVNPAIEDILKVVEHIPLDVIQAHGNETVPYILQIKEATALPVWKAIHHSPDSLSRMRTYEGIVDGFVIDARTKSEWGGTGKRFDWSHIPSYLNEAKRQNVACFIAGGINPSNIDEIIHYEPDGIDLSSGIETNGRKDKHKIEQLEERLINYEKSNT